MSLILNIYLIFVLKVYLRSSMHTPALLITLTIKFIKLQFKLSDIYIATLYKPLIQFSIPTESKLSHCRALVRTHCFAIDI